MPDYRIRDPHTGRVVTLRGDSPPSEAELEQVFAADDDDSISDSGDRGGSSGVGLAAGAAMKAAPAIVAGVNRGAGMVSKLARSRLTPAVIAGSVVNDLSNGDLRGAATTAAVSGTAGYVLPKVAAYVQQTTSPASPATRGTGGRFTSIGRAAGPIARVASAASRAAGPIGLAAETIFGEGNSGHRPAGETVDTTAQRQSTFAHNFARQINEQAGYTVIPTEGRSVPEIIEAITRYRR